MEEIASAAGRNRRWIIRGLVPVIGAALFLLGLIVAGRMALEHLRDQQRFALPFSDIDCPPPPGMERDEFLSEVRYLTGLPAQMRLLNDDLPAQLASAFARHPWVEQVEEVAVTPPRLVRVRLAFRRPVLAVPYAGQLRAVDRHGVLLPATAPTDGLPVFDGQAHPPNGPAGTRWGDEAVEGAARGLGPGAAGG